MNQRLPPIGQVYGLPPLEHVTAVADGFISENHILESAGERYFLKRYRFTEREGSPRDRVGRVHRAKFFFAERGIPVILPLACRDGATFFEWDDGHGLRCYALFPYVDGIKTVRGEMADAVLRSAGELLAKLHAAGHNVFDIAPLTSKANFDPKPFWEKTAQILSIIDEKASGGQPLTEFDELARESLALKRGLAEQNPPIFHELGLVDEHLIHGDFHNANFFVDEQGTITHLFDWEQTKATAREVEVLRSTLFMCLQKSDDYLLRFDDDNIRQAQTYLERYHSIYPLEEGKVAAAVENRFLGSLYSTWIEESHYLQNNHRVDIFLPGDLHMIRYLAQHRQSFTDRLWGVIQ